jgi:hypothetical protein
MNLKNPAVKLLGMGLAVAVGFGFWYTSGDRASGIRPNFGGTNWCVVQKYKASALYDHVLASASNDGMFDPKAKKIEFRTVRSILPFGMFNDFWISGDVTEDAPASIIASTNSTLMQSPIFKPQWKGNFCKVQKLNRNILK